MKADKLELLNDHVEQPRYRYIGRKGIYLEPSDFEYEFASMERRALMASEFAGNKKLLDATIFTKYDDDFFTNVPSCPCGWLKTGKVKGEICPICHQECLPQTERELKSTIWIDALPGVDWFFNPMVYKQIDSVLKVYKEFHILNWLMDPRYKSQELNNPYELAMEQLGLPRGMIAFRENFEDIMETLIAARPEITINGVTSRQRLMNVSAAGNLKRFISKYKDRFFTRQLPFPSSVAFILEEHNGRTRGDHRHAKLLNSLYSIVNANERLGTMHIREKESIMARVSISIADHAQAYEHKEFFEKTGVFRKLVYGFRSHWTFRTVITSNHGVNRRNELHVPWGVAVMTYKLHIANKLLRRGRSPNQIFDMIYNNTHRYHRTLDEIFKELIAESPEGKGLPTLFTRYPSLKHGSTQLYRISKIKTDPNDVSVSNSPLNLVSLNGDYDGDYMTGMCILDNHLLEHFKRMEPHTGLMDLSKPFTVSNHARQPEPILHTLNQRLLWCEDHAVEK